MASMTPIPAGAPPERFGLPFWMDRALKELEHVRSSADPDSVHDARVAIRRCRSLASAMQEVDLHPAWRKMRKLPRKLFRALGSLRDAQVLQDRVKQLSWEGDAVRESLLQLLAEREAASRGRVLRSAQRFDEKIWKRLARTLGRRARLVPPGSLAAQCLALERYEEAHELHTRALQIEKPKPWHALRIGLKRFRYTVENLLPDLYASWEDDLKQVQDLLGDLQDFSVLDALLKKASAGILLASAEAMRDRLAAERKQRIANYRQRTLGDAGLWKKWRPGLPSNSHVEAAALARLRATARALDPHPRRTAQAARFSLRLFDALARSGCAPRFREPALRRILRAAVLLHGIGASAGRKSPHKAARDILLRLPQPPGWTRESWETLAWTLRYHRGAEAKRRGNNFVRLNQEQRNDVCGLAGVLRLARALRRCGVDSVAGLRVVPSADAVRLQIPNLTINAAAAARLAAGKHLLETYLQKPVFLEPAGKVVTLPKLPVLGPEKISVASD